MGACSHRHIGEKNRLLVPFRVGSSGIFEVAWEAPVRVIGASTGGVRAGLIRAATLSTAEKWNVASRSSSRWHRPPTH